MFTLYSLQRLVLSSTRTWTTAEEGQEGRRGNIGVEGKGVKKRGSEGEVLKLIAKSWIRYSILTSVN